MDFSLTEEQELLLASIRELITTNFPEEYFRTCDQNGTYPREFMRALADNGISMLGVPEEFGGIPADYVTQMLALMEVSKCGAPAFLITNGQCIHSMRRFVKMRCSGIFNYQRSMYSQYAPFRFCRAAT